MDEQTKENQWWLESFQNNWLNPTVTVCVIILCFLLVRWISYSGYPIFGSSWAPIWLYMGRGLTAFFEKEQLSQIKQDDVGNFWTLFDPRNPLSPESEFNSNEPPRANELKIYAATNLFQRYWAACSQIGLSLVHALVTLFMLPARTFFSLFYYFKDPEWKQIHGNDAFYLIGEPPSVVWRNNEDVRGPEPMGPQTDVRGNSFNWLSTLLSRVAFVTTFGMDRMIYSNLRMLPHFRTNESRWGWIVVSLAIFFLVYLGFYWITDADPVSISGFIIVWMFILGFAWYKGGWKLAFYNPIHGLLPKLNTENWGKPTSFHDFFRSFLRNVYDGENGALPTSGPLAEALQPPKQQGGENTQWNAQSLNQIDEAEQILLPKGTVVPERVTQAYETYQRRVIPNLVYQAFEMHKYREQQAEEYKKKQEELQGILNATKPKEPETPEELLGQVASQTTDALSDAFGSEGSLFGDAPSLPGSPRATSPITIPGQPGATNPMAMLSQFTGMPNGVSGQQPGAQGQQQEMNPSDMLGKLAGKTKGKSLFGRKKLRGGDNSNVMVPIPRDWLEIKKS